MINSLYLQSFFFTELSKGTKAKTVGRKIVLKSVNIKIKRFYDKEIDIERSTEILCM